MRKHVLSALALACLFLAIGCDTEPADEAKKDKTPATTTTPPAETTITATLDTATGSAIPAEFTADVSWKIKDSEWKADDVYVAQAWFAGTDGTPVAIGSSFTFDKTQTGTGKYKFKIPDDGLPATVKKPYELTIVVKRGDAQVWKSPAWTFTEGKISGVYTGKLYYYTAYKPDGVTPSAADDYLYSVQLDQYGTLVVGTNVKWLKSPTVSVPQTCTVVMTASTKDGVTTLKGEGTFTNHDDPPITSRYSGELEVFGDGRSLSCDAYWLSSETVAMSRGTFDADKKGTASISGKVTITNPGSLPESEILFANDSEYDCVVALLYSLTGDDLEECAGRKIMGPIEKSGTGPDYSFSYTIPDIPEGSYYIYFGGTDPESSNHLPYAKGEAVGLLGLEPSIALKWIDGKSLTGTEKTSFDALVPITVSAGQTIIGKDFDAIIRSTPKS